MPQVPLRIAILECDTPIDFILNKYGRYGPIFASLLRSAAHGLKHPGLSSSSGLELSFYDVVEAQDYPVLEDIDAVLLSGAKYTPFHNDPWILKLAGYVEEMLKQKRVRIIGVCFGHQIVGRALGARVGRSEEGWEVSVTAIDLTKRGQEIFQTNSLAVQQMRRDLVLEYPEGVEQLAYTAKCHVHGMYIAKRLITVQGHPEYNGDMMKALLEYRHEKGVIDDETFEDGMPRVDKHADGVLVAQAFLRFLLEE